MGGNRFTRARLCGMEVLGCQVWSTQHHLLGRDVGRGSHYGYTERTAPCRCLAAADALPRRPIGPRICRCLAYKFKVSTQMGNGANSWAAALSRCRLLPGVFCALCLFVP